MKVVLELRPPESRHYPSWHERLRTVARYSRPDEVHALCEKAHAVGARAVMAVFDDAIREALLAFQGWRGVPVWAVVPNMFSFIRDLTDLGMVGAAAARLRRLAVPDMLRTGLGALMRVDRVMRRDFTTGAMLVAEMELRALHGLHVSRILLHPQLTEIALAGGVTGLFAAVLSRAEAMGVEAGLITHNPLRAREVLGRDLGRFAAVVVPCSPAGYKMFPDRETCETLLRGEPERHLAAEVTAAGHVKVADAMAHVQRLGLRGAVLDPAAVEAAFREGLVFS